MTTCYRESYAGLINQMASDMDLNGELPSMYCDEFKSAVAALLLQEKTDNKKSYGYIQFSCLVDNFRENGEIFDLVAKYIKYDEEDESKANIAIKIADEIMKSALLFYRDDIERETEELYRRKYQQEYYGSFEQIPHSL